MKDNWTFSAEHEGDSPFRQMMLAMLENEKKQMENFIQEIDRSRSKKLDELIVEGLKLKNIKFETEEQLIDICRNYVSVTLIEESNLLVYYVFGEAFLVFKSIPAVIDDSEIDVIKIGTTIGQYKFL